MKLKDLYKTIIEIGMKGDPRNKRALQKILLDNKKEFHSLKGSKKAFFDKDSLFNPYSDTRILYGDREKDIEKILVGIDIDGTELLLADKFNQQGRSIDLVMSHHPGGRALVELHRVMQVQTDQLKKLGVTPEVANDMMVERMAEVERSCHTRNSMRNVDIARMLDIAYMCAHTVADNMVNTFLQDLMDKKHPKTLGAVIDLLESIHEYREGAKIGIGPKILVGNKNAKSGKIYIDMTGGTEGSKRVFSRLSQIGIGTIIGMHFSEQHFKQAKKERINVVIAGHIPSDNVGLNLLFDELIKKEDLSIVACSGFTRHSRI